MPDLRSAPQDEVAALRAANARLRRIIEGKDELITAMEARQRGELAVRDRRIVALAARLAEVERRLSMDSSNSSTSPSTDSIAAKAKRTAARQSSQRERSKDRKPGGPPGHAGSGLEPAKDPDRTERVAAPADCAGCGEELARAAAAGCSWARGWDVPPIALERVHYLLPRRRCGSCNKITTAVPPFGQAGTVVYGVNVNAAAMLLALEGNVPVQRTAMLMKAPL